MGLTFSHIIDSEAGLAEFYRAPSQMVSAKSMPAIDDATAAFLARSTFAIVGTSGADGSLDTSPRGGDPGFVQILDPTRIAIADLNGNNRLDSIRNVVATGRIGLLFVVVGRSETVRINGRACVTTDPAVLDAFPDTFRRPKTAIGVDIDEVFVHCAKAFTRGHVWDPEYWADNDLAPDAAEMLVCQNLIPAEIDLALVRAEFAKGYAEDLAADR